MGVEISLGRAIRSRRDELGLTQEELAERAVAHGDETIRQSDVSRIERGKVRMPRLTRLDALAKALEIDLGDLLTRAGWLDPAFLQAVGEQAQPARSEQGVEPAPAPSARPLEASDQAIRRAYHDLSEALGDTVARREEFERRRSEFEEMVKLYARARRDYERKRGR